VQLGKQREEKASQASVDALAPSGAAGARPEAPAWRNPKLQELRAICPEGASDAALAFLLEKLCGNRAEVAATYILDHGPAQVEARYEAEQLATAERERKAAERAAAEDERVRKAVMSRFDEFAVVEGGAKGNSAAEKSAKKTLRRMKRQQQADRAANQLRYLDGKVVSRKGERFTVIDETVEWNGGSKGRVITKGKRGPGFVSG